MKQSKEYAKRVKQLFQSLVRKHGKPDPVEPKSAIDQLLESILWDCSTQHKAEAVLQKILAMMVDLNELRVTPPMELEYSIGDGVPLGHRKAQQLVDALNDIRKRQEDLDLGFLKDRGRREAREYLESLSGVSKAAAARVVLFCLGGHAVPVDDLTLYILRKENLVHESASLEDVQSFLERHISAADGQAFSLLLEKHVTSKSSRVPLEKLHDMLYPKPPEPEPEPEPEVIEEPPVVEAASKKKSKSKKADSKKAEPKKASTKKAAAKASKADEEKPVRKKAAAKTARKAVKEPAVKAAKPAKKVVKKAEKVAKKPAAKKAKAATKAAKTVTKAAKKVAKTAKAPKKAAKKVAKKLPKKTAKKAITKVAKKVAKKASAKSAATKKSTKKKSRK